MGSLYLFTLHAAGRRLCNKFEFNCNCFIHSFAEKDCSESCEYIFKGHRLGTQNSQVDYRGHQDLDPNISFTDARQWTPRTTLGVVFEEVWIFWVISSSYRYVCVCECMYATECACVRACACAEQWRFWTCCWLSSSTLVWRVSSQSSRRLICRRLDISVVLEVSSVLCSLKRSTLSTSPSRLSLTLC